MWKKVLVGAAALAIAGSSLVYAQQRFGGPDGPRPMQRFQFSADDIAAFADARIAAMRAGLRLTSEQEKNWPAFEDGYRALAKLRAERIEASQNRQRPGSVVEFMQRRADAMSRGAAAFKQFSDAAVPLYQSLDDAQKRRFDILARALRPKPRMAAWMMHRGGHWHGSPRDGLRPGGHFEPGYDRGLERRRFGDRDFDDRRFEGPRRGRGRELNERHRDGPSEL